MDNYTYWNKNRAVFYERLDEFLKETNQHLDIYETNPSYAIFSAFEYWLRNDKDAQYLGNDVSLSVWLEQNKNNELYFSPKYSTIMNCDYIKSQMHKREDTHQITYESKEENIVKKTCKELGLTYAQLAEQIGYSEPAIKKAIANDNVSEPMKKAISLYLRILDLEKQLEDYSILKSAIKKAIN